MLKHLLRAPGATGDEGGEWDGEQPPAPGADKPPVPATAATTAPAKPAFAPAELQPPPLNLPRPNVTAPPKEPIAAQAQVSQQPPVRETFPTGLAESFKLLRQYEQTRVPAGTRESQRAWQENRLAAVRALKKHIHALQQGQPLLTMQAKHTGEENNEFRRNDIKRTTWKEHAHGDQVAAQMLEYITELEATVKTLTSGTATLQAENESLKKKIKP
jgi:hypothetical protein